MFTGIVQTMGIVQSIQPGSAGVRLTLDCPGLMRPVELGASVCVSGVCLTVTAADERSLSFDVIPETLSRSTLGDLRPGGRVNLERSLRAGDRMDGHAVQGHVDGTARVSGIVSGPGGHVVTLEGSAELMPYIIPKGSVCVDGVSLTIADVQADTFSVALIPTTLSVTTLGALGMGDRVNIETDILARTVVATCATVLRSVLGQSVPSDPLLTEQRRADANATEFSLNSLRENGWA